MDGKGPQWAEHILVLMKKHEEQSEYRFAAEKELFESKLVAMQAMVEAALADIKDRLTKMNEIREQLNDQAATFMRADQYEVRHTSIVQRIETVEKALISVRGNVMLQMITAAASVAAVVGVLVAFWRH